ncbi:pyk1 [Symbiodinium sp. CCMP2592]|nr:pyk1 [Symbiodinium sp. CCMP2592]
MAPSQMPSLDSRQTCDSCSGILGLRSLVRSSSWPEVNHPLSDKDADQCMLWFAAADTRLKSAGQRELFCTCSFGGKECLQPRSAKDAMAAPARDVKAELKRKSWGSATTRSGSSQDGLEECGGDLDPFDPSEDVLQLGIQINIEEEHMQRGCIAACDDGLIPQWKNPKVDDLMEWRVLIQHLSEMGRLDRSESILEFASQWHRVATDAVNLEDELDKDLRQRKFCECRWWCMRLANVDKTHFPESDVNDMVSANLGDLLEHCCDEDVAVRKAAHYLVMNYGFGGLPFVQRLIAEAMLDRMEDLLPESGDISKEAFEQAMQCATHLTTILRALTKSQRQKWVSLLIRALQIEEQDEVQETLISDLKILWRVDDDPRRSYAEAEEQLKTFSVHANRQLQYEIWLVTDGQFFFSHLKSGVYNTAVYGHPVARTKVECLGDLQGPKFRVGELATDPIPLVNGEILELPRKGCFIEELGVNVECLGDLQGPKFRVGELAGEPVQLQNGDILEFGICKDDNDLIKPGRITMIPTTEQNALVEACKVGTVLLIEDGLMEVKVTEKISSTELKVEVTRGGKLKARKGVNVPDLEIDCAALTAKDIEDAEYLLQLDPPIEFGISVDDNDNIKPGRSTLKLMEEIDCSEEEWSWPATPETWPAWAAAKQEMIPKMIEDVRPFWMEMTEGDEGVTPFDEPLTGKLGRAPSWTTSVRLHGPFVTPPCPARQVLRH